MKNIFLLCFVTILVQSCCVDGSCNDDVDTLSIITDYEPVFLERAAFEASVTLNETKPIINSGKIYVVEDLLFVNEKNEGFHIIDNTDPENPLPIAFINAPGATDLAIKNNIFFINQAVDLIAVSYTRESNTLIVSKRIRNVFPVMISPDGYTPNVTEDSIIINYTLRN